MSAKVHKTVKKLTHGDRLRQLADWYGSSYSEFAKKIDRSEKWLYDAFKLERIPTKNLVRISRAMNVPFNYFDGEFTLPNSINELPVPKFQEQTHQSLNEVSNEQYSQLIERNRYLQDKMIQLQDELLRLMRELAEARENAR